ncbi:MAG: EndoU domain-containing protein [Actinomycetota bacterium]|nr:EndoU domain-containing protein [Actinomycetota bacterium]
MIAGISEPESVPYEIRVVAIQLYSIADRHEDAGDALVRVAVRLQQHWCGGAGDAAWQELLALCQQARETAPAFREAADALLACATQLEAAKDDWEKARTLAAQERAALPGPQVFSQAGVHAQRAASDARGAISRAAAILHSLADKADPSRVATTATLSAGDQLRGVVTGAWDAVREPAVEAAELSTVRLLADPRGWAEEVRLIFTGARYAASDPDELADLLGYAPGPAPPAGETVGGILPDAVLGPMTRGIGPAVRKSYEVADRLADLGEQVEQLERVGRQGPAPLTLPAGTGGPVVPAPGVVLPAGYPTQVRDLTAERRRHILAGDLPRRTGRPSNGGGHRPGTGKAGKSEFPPGWDDERIIKTVMQTARQPEHGAPDDGSYVVRARVEGILVQVVVRPDGTVVTGYPEEGPGVVRNPKRPSS